MKVYEFGIKKLRQMLDGGEISARELAGEYFKRIRERGELGCFITVAEEEAYRAAEKAEEMIRRGDVRMLTGIPIAVKDNICTKGIKTTCASRMLEDFVPPYDATVVKKLKAYGAVILGKTNMDEFAMCSTSLTSYFGPVKNPLDKSRVAGGSSGGSAAAVAAGLCAGALGSDTGGSIRQPAAFCGVTGIKPTYGSVSRHGLIAFASSLDQIGPIAKSAADCAVMMDAITDYDPNDATMRAPECFDYSAKIGKDLKGKKIGIIKEFFGDDVDGGVKTAVLDAAKVFEGLGCELVWVSLPSFEYALMAYIIISSAEAASNLARYDGIKFGYRSPNAATYEELLENTRGEGFGAEVKRRIMLGNFVLSHENYAQFFERALSVKERIKGEFAALFEKCDCLIAPTAVGAAFKADSIELDTVKRLKHGAGAIPANLAGLPAISTTCGYDESALPIGMSIIGRRFDEAGIIAMAAAFENQFEKRGELL